MYKIVVQLQDLSIHGAKNIHEIHSKQYLSIQEAFESVESGKEMFETYLACEQEIMKSVNDILSK